MKYKWWKFVNEVFNVRSYILPRYSNFVWKCIGRPNLCSGSQHVQSGFMDYFHEYNICSVVTTMLPQTNFSVITPVIKYFMNDFPIGIVE